MYWIHIPQLFQIAIEGQASGRGSGQIAIDDIEFQAGECDYQPPEATVTTEAPKTTTPQPTSTPGAFFECQYERDEDELCGWTNKAEEKWKLTKVRIWINF